jgi:selenium metabolism protein YedF
MGTGNDDLGAVLIKGFIYALTQQDTLPQTILCYNGGAKLTCEGSPALEDLKSMEAQGVEILTCGTCLDYYGLKEKLQVGSVTNMYVIVEKLEAASKVIRP